MVSYVFSQIKNSFSFFYVILLAYTGELGSIYSATHHSLRMVVLVIENYI